MTRLLNRVGDTLLALVAPRAEATADPTYTECRCFRCFLQQRTCGPGGCTAWQTIGNCYVQCDTSHTWGC
ncbi:hypothetical protein [Streptosporangium carneum]|uniref:Uncharacterized protein n=1 Tax=Streptosporangium carneum TaxID=47481 RepID=A0A9W6ME94_9ACTN|nr:hypothetical protein [Streptosporangium carneum]GLK10887.1 hypothetical protein GCM10017600_42930 [Streptosporangium carneum]